MGAATQHINNSTAQSLKADTHPVHAVVVPDFQLLLGLLEAGMLIVISRGFKIDIHIISWHCMKREG